MFTRYFFSWNNYSKTLTFCMKANEWFYIWYATSPKDVGPGTRIMHKYSVHFPYHYFYLDQEWHDQNHKTTWSRDLKPCCEPTIPKTYACLKAHELLLFLTWWYWLCTSKDVMTCVLLQKKTGLSQNYFNTSLL